MPFYHGGHLLKDLGSFAAVQGGEINITYLLDFVAGDYANAGSIVSPIVARVGELTLVQTDGSFYFDSGLLKNNAQTTPGYNALVAYVNQALDRANGYAYYVRIRPVSVDTLGFFTGFNSSTSWGTTGTFVESLDYRGTTLIIDNPFFNTGIPIALNAWHEFVVVTRNEGAYIFLRDATYTDWTLIWITNTSTAATLYNNLQQHGGVSHISCWRLASLPANASYPVPALGVRDLDLCSPESFEASPVSGSAISHTSDFIARFTLGAGGGSDTVTIYLYRLASSGYNIEIIYTEDNGNLWIFHTINGSRSFTGTVAAGVASSGDEISARCLDGALVIHVNDTQVISTEINSAILGAGGLTARYVGVVPITDFSARTLDGVANVGSSNFPGYGVATDVLPGPRSEGDTFVHEADCIIEWNAQTISANWASTFREQDVNNRWEVWHYTSGNFQLYERVDGSATSRGLAPSVLSGGEKIRIIASGEIIKGYYNETLAWTYSNATNFKTETDGRIRTLPAGQICSNLITRPLTPASAPNTPAAAGIATAFNVMATP